MWYHTAANKTKQTRPLLAPKVLPACHPPAAGAGCHSSPRHHQPGRGGWQIGNGVGNGAHCHEQVHSLRACRAAPASSHATPRCCSIAQRGTFRHSVSKRPCTWAAAGNWLHAICCQRLHVTARSPMPKDGCLRYRHCLCPQRTSAHVLCRHRCRCCCYRCCRCSRCCRRLHAPVH
jgi:hypothetical protein